MGGKLPAPFKFRYLSASVAEQGLSGRRILYARGPSATLVSTFVVRRKGKK